MDGRLGDDPVQQLQPPQRGGGGLLRQLPPLPGVGRGTRQRRPRSRRRSKPERYPSPTGARHPAPDRSSTRRCRTAGAHAATATGLPTPRRPRPDVTPCATLVAAIDAERRARGPPRPPRPRRAAGRGPHDGASSARSPSRSWASSSAARARWSTPCSRPPPARSTPTSSPACPRWSGTASSCGSSRTASSPGELEETDARRCGSRTWPRWCPSGRTSGASDVRSVEVRVPHRMLRTGLCLLDTPGVGGLESVHGQLSLASLNGADGVLFVTDASQELTAPELELPQDRRRALPAGRAGRHQDRPAPALAARSSRPTARHLADAGLDIPVLPVSSFLRLRARTQPALNEESGFAPAGGVPRRTWCEQTAEPAGRRPSPTRSTSSPPSWPTSPTPSGSCWPDPRSAQAVVATARRGAPAGARR